MLTNFSSRRLKLSDFNINGFIIDILPFFVQNFNLINLDWKLDNEKEIDMVKCLWDEYIPHEFLRYIYNSENYIIISNPKLTYQKANEIVVNFVTEDINRINLLKSKIVEKFKLIHYSYSFLFLTIYNKINHFGIQIKSNFDFNFSIWKARKQNGSIAAKIVDDLSTNQKSTDVLSKPKNPKDYKDREIKEFEQAPIHFEKIDSMKVKIKKRNGHQ